MTKTLQLRGWLALGVSAAALTCGAPAFAQGAPGTQPGAGPAGAPGDGLATSAAPTATALTPNAAGAIGEQGAGGQVGSTTPRKVRAADNGTVIQELVVTAQKREESIQSVPIAVSAFSGNALKAARVDGGENLVLQVPNVNFSRGNFGGFNFQIRGIGTKLVATGADAATEINENNVPLIANTLADTDFYDTERVEVLRGPQGTLFGRNATGGVVNIITAKPVDRLTGSLTSEVGNYGDFRAIGVVNVPLGDKFAVRVAAFHLNRDGFGKNDFTGDNVDGRDVFSTRTTVSFKPNDKFSAFFIWEHFNETDNRSRVGKQLCISDPGPASVGGVPTNAATRGFLSQGCLSGSLYSPAALGEVNTSATLGGLLGNLTGLTSGNATAGQTQDPNLYNIQSVIDPTYKTRQENYILNLQYNLTDHLLLTSLSHFDNYRQFTLEDYNRFVPSQTLNATPFSPGGVFTDPQVGASNKFRTFDESLGDTSEISSEMRLQSSFTGPINFNVGGIYIKYDDHSDYYVLGNTLTGYNRILNATTPSAVAAGCGLTGANQNPACFYEDPSFPPTGLGHNYYDNRSYYSLVSRAAFGEVYYQILPDVKLTGGFRYTDDTKKNAYLPVQLFAPGIGLAPGNPSAACPQPLPTGFISRCQQSVEFQEETGRANIEWTPHLSFTDQTLVYAQYARGYKGGGFNPPGSVGVAGVQANYAPEFVDAYEIGTKNTLLHGSLQLNLTGFYYNYTGYQVSAIINRTSVNTNLNATIKGLEFEGIWEPIRHLRLNGTMGLLDTNITGGSQVDVFNRTQGDPTLTVVKASDASNCVAPTAGVAGIQTLINSGILGSTAILGICSGAFSGAANPLAPFGISATPSQGTAVNLKGNDLPNAPNLTVNFGAQYDFSLPHDFTLTPRVDVYHQESSYARIFNTPGDKLRSYENVNATLNLNNRREGFSVQLFVKNVFDNVVITDSYLTDDSSGLFRNIFLNEPRSYGISVTKVF